MHIEEAKTAVLSMLRQQGKAKNSEILALIGNDEALLEKVREDLLFAELAEDIRGAGLRFTGPTSKSQSEKDTDGPAKIFLSYGRRDAGPLAERLERDLKAHGYEVWRDIHEIRSGTDWQGEITDGLRSAQIVVALLTPHSTRTTRDASSPDAVDSVCLGELSYALFNPPPLPVVPVMALSCEPPLAIFHLDYVDMRRWQENEDQYQLGLKRLLDGIEAARRGEKNYRSWHHLLDPFDFAAFLHHKREGFTGRKWLFDSIDIWRQSHGRDRSLLIKGDPGTGKSAIVAELVHRNPDGQVLAYHCCQWDTAQTLEPWRFVRSVAAMIAGKLEDYAALLADPTLREILSETSCRTDPASAFERGILTPLQKLHQPEGGPRYLLIDALDEALLVAPGQPDLVSMLASRLDRLPPWLRLVATTRKDPAVLDRLTGLCATEIEAKSAENLADLRAYIRGRLENGELSEQVRESNRSLAALTSSLVEKSAGNFLYVRRALDDIAADIYSLRNLDTLPPGLRGLYAERFTRLFPDEDAFANARAILEVVCAAREPIDRQLLADASGLGENLPRLLVRLAAYIPRQVTLDGRAVYAVYHKSLSDWLTDPEREGQTHQTPLRDGHRRLADACWKYYQQAVEEMPAYALAHLIPHLIESARWPEIETALLHLPYLECRVTAGQSFSLAQDFAATVKALPPERSERSRLRLIEEALRRDLHFIASHAQDYSQALFQSLWNTCWWYDCSEAAAHYETPPDGWKVLPPWAGTPENLKLSTLLQRWRSERKAPQSGFWVLSKRPPVVPLGAGQLAVFRGHRSTVNDVAFSPDCSRILSCSSDKTARLWDASSGRELTVLTGHENWVTKVAFSRDCRRLLTASYDQTLRIWDAENGRELAVLRGHVGPVYGAAFSPDGRHIVSGSEDKTVRLWGAESGEVRAVFQLTGRPAHAVAFSSDGRRIIAGSFDSLRIWDVANATEAVTPCDRVSELRADALSTNGRFALSKTDESATICVLDVESGSELAVLRGHEARITHTAFSPDGQRVVSASEDKTIRVWETETGNESVVLHDHVDRIFCVAVSSDGRHVLTGARDYTVRLRDARSERELPVLRGRECYVTTLAFSPDGRRVVAGCGDRSFGQNHTVRLWETKTGLESAILKGHESTINSVAFSPDGRRVLSGGHDKTVRLWDVESRSELLVLHGHEDQVSKVAFSPNGLRLLSGSWDKTLRLWDAGSGREQAVLRGHKGDITSLDFSPDSRRLASGGQDKTVRLWDVETGSELFVLRGHDGTVFSVAFSPDSRRVISGSSDDLIRLWDVESGRELAVLAGHEHTVVNLAFSSDGLYIISRESTGKTRVWDVESGRCVSDTIGAAALTRNFSEMFGHISVEKGETLFYLRPGSKPVARFHEALQRKCRSHGRMWASPSEGHFLFLQLEGLECPPAD